MLFSQVLRSADRWSTGTCECSILNAYIHTIENSEHYIYIEVRRSIPYDTMMLYDTITNSIFGNKNKTKDENILKNKNVLVLVLVLAFWFCLFKHQPHTQPPSAFSFALRTSSSSAVPMGRPSTMVSATPSSTESFVLTGAVAETGPSRSDSSFPSSLSLLLYFWLSPIFFFPLGVHTSRPWRQREEEVQGVCGDPAAPWVWRRRQCRRWKRHPGHFTLHLQVSTALTCTH